MAAAGVCLRLLCVEELLAMSAIKDLLLGTRLRADEAAEERRLDRLDAAWDDAPLPLPTPVRPLVRNGVPALDHLTSQPLFQVAAGFAHEGARGTKSELEALTGGPVMVPHPDLGYDVDTGVVLALVLGRWCIARNLLHHNGQPLLLEDRCEGWVLVALATGEEIARWPIRPNQEAIRIAATRWAARQPQLEARNWPPTGSHVGLIEGN
jgi:hypothetical protein